ncbi:MAG: nucleoside monophosphate kinase, partial [Planctomycetales bacterium]|nr:nucleoside monophosphate kinase [Planctomycetales bacterium]
MLIVLLGAPGSGKGTQCNLLVQQLKLPHLSTGELFRFHISQSTPLGKRAQ